MKTKEEILDEYGCPSIPFDENVTMYYPAILEAMEEYAQQQVKNLNMPAVIKSVCTAYPLADSANRKHSIEIIKKLTSRPEKKDSDGYYDFYNDEQQMIEIVEKYLNRHFR